LKIIAVFSASLGIRPSDSEVDLFVVSSKLVVVLSNGILAKVGVLHHFFLVFFGELGYSKVHFMLHSLYLVDVVIEFIITRY